MLKERNSIKSLPKDIFAKQHGHMVTTLSVQETGVTSKYGTCTFSRNGKRDLNVILLDLDDVFGFVRHEIRWTVFN